MTDPLDLSPHTGEAIKRTQRAIKALAISAPLLAELGAELESLTHPLAGSSAEPGSRSKGSHSDPTAAASDRRARQKGELRNFHDMLGRVVRVAEETQRFFDAYLTPLDPGKARALTACVWHGKAGLIETDTHYSNCAGKIPQSLHLCRKCIRFVADTGTPPTAEQLKQGAKTGRIMRSAS